MVSDLANFFACLVFYIFIYLFFFAWEFDENKFEERARMVFIIPFIVSTKKRNAKRKSVTLPFIGTNNICAYNSVLFVLLSLLINRIKILLLS